MALRISLSHVNVAGSYNVAFRRSFWLLSLCDKVDDIAGCIALHDVAYSDDIPVITLTFRSYSVRITMLLANRALLLNLFVLCTVLGSPEEEQGVKYASKCEVCKVVAIELEARLDETGKTHDVLEMGYSVDEPKKKKEYKKSELRLLESLENVCERILEYNIHKERTDSTRFAKGMSQTFSTLHNLVNKGVKVELGLPYELWDKPSVEITTLKTQCEDLLENHEFDIENWYHKHQNEIPLTKYLCQERALKDEDSSCLYEKGDTGKGLETQKKEALNAEENTKDNSQYVKKEL